MQVLSKGFNSVTLLFNVKKKAVGKSTIAKNSTK